LHINDVILLSLVDGFLFILGEGGGHIFGKEGDKWSEKPIKELLFGGYFFA
jgi:hypothetical protein